MSFFYSKSAAAGYDADAQEFFDRADAAGVLSSGSKALYNTLVLTAKADGWWGDPYRLNMEAGDFAVSAVPLIKTLGHTLDAYVNLDASDYAEATGIKGDIAAGGYIDTGVAVNSLTSGNTGLVFAGASMEALADPRCPIGAIGTGSTGLLIYCSFSGSIRRFYSGDRNADYTPDVAAAVLIGSQITTTDTKIFSNGTQKATNGTTAAALAGTATISVLARNNNGTRDRFTAAYCRGYAITQGLSSAKVTSITNAFEAFNDGLSRGVI